STLNRREALLALALGGALAMTGCSQREGAKSRLVSRESTIDGTRTELFDGAVEYKESWDSAGEASYAFHIREPGYFSVESFWQNATLVDPWDNPIQRVTFSVSAEQIVGEEGEYIRPIAYQPSYSGYDGSPLSHRTVMVRFQPEGTEEIRIEHFSRR
ncbi:MAG: hypothetical protein KDD70_07435, partial [Bdellovibrionales bacterium]|nr:hypothetical protein [Bdellovibrionales bacterium]